MKVKSVSVLLLVAAFCLHADEGMIPISEIGKVDLRARGLAVSADDIFRPGGGGLVEAVVQFPGGTGSFVSAEGLIITNHHIAFGAIQAASSPEHDYLRDGFLAADRGGEIPARGYTVRIVESVEDVSAEILAALKPRMDFAARARAVETRIKEIVLREEKERPGKRAEVGEMFPGKTFLLFVCTYLRDVRLVYAPPRGIGDFGGETDNWAWPRHTGDFSFLRAYVGADGQPADYAAGNVPYRPRVFLPVSPEGVAEGDAVFILGYPGRTYRHTTSHYLAFEQRVRMPAVADLGAWQIAEMEKLSAADPAVAIKLAGRVKGLANTVKNYRAKIRGMQRLDLVGRRRAEEARLQAFIAADRGRRNRWGTLLADSEAYYRELEPWQEHELLLDALTRVPTLLGAANAIVESVRERGKPETEREAAWMSRNVARTREAIRLSLANHVPAADALFLKSLLERAAKLPAGYRIAAVDGRIGGGDPAAAVAAFVERAIRDTRMADVQTVMAWLEKSPAEVAAAGDPLLAFARDLQPAVTALRDLRRARKGRLDRLYAMLIDARREFLQADFVPDANSTLRFTSGRIRGYRPADAVSYAPLTTLRGVVEKHTGEWPFQAPAALLERQAARDYGPFAMAGGELPVDMLYDADTTGGNSGSPVLDAQGRLVGVNFDRTGEATINDYTWSADFSRSIAVDIRYVLWVASRLGGAGHLLREMGVGM